MSDNANESFGEQIAKQAICASVATVVGAIVGSILFPGPGTVAGVKLGALLSALTTKS